MATQNIEDEENQPWSEWLAELQAMLGNKVASFNGWGECYNVGLTPTQAIACRDHGEGREAVVEYCSAEGGEYNLVFG